MNKYKFMSLLLMTFLMLSFNNIDCDVKAAVQTPERVATNNVTTVSPLSIVANPDKFLNKTVTFTGDFVAFTSLGLDYKPAFRDGAKYIGMLIKRDDVKNHVIPLSELKMFVLREEAEKHTDIEQGDKVKITGKVFSTALGDPWFDITSFEVLTKKENKAEKK